MEITAEQRSNRDRLLRMRRHKPPELALGSKYKSSYLNARAVAPIIGFAWLNASRADYPQNIPVPAHHILKTSGAVGRKDPLGSLPRGQSARAHIH